MSNELQSLRIGGALAQCKALAERMPPRRIRRKKGTPPRFPLIELAESLPAVIEPVIKPSREDVALFNEYRRTRNKILAKKRRRKGNTLASKARHLRALNALGSHSDAEFDLIVWLFQNRCAYCQERFEKLTREHVIPLKHGGTHDIENILPACKHCNSRKGAMIA